MRVLISALIMGLLTACSPSIPDSGAGSGGGIGFDNSVEAQRAREAALNTGQPQGQLMGQPLARPGVLSDELPASSGAQMPIPTVVTAQPLPAAVAGSGVETSDDIATETAAVLAAANANSGQAPLQASPSNPSPQSNAGISDENDFSAVSDRQSISSDAQRIAQNRAQYQVVQPTALPSRSGASSPNIVEYALGTSNPRGARVYSRSGFNGSAKAARNCARFASPDQAQIEFLSNGGPQKDRKGLDPDGDGYACTWDPAPFRQAAQN